MNANSWLLMGALLSTLAALLHVGCIVFGGPWYRFFGAGEKMAAMAEAGKWFPHIVTAGIVVVLLVWAGYALSGAAVITRWPLTKPALVAITTVYLVRGVGGFWMVLVPLENQSVQFAFWSSAICTLIGLVHLSGLMGVWPQL